MNIDSILIAEYASTDRDGRLTVVNAFNQIAGPGPQWVIPVMAISLVIHGHSEEAETEHKGEIRLINDARELVRAAPFEFAFPQATVPGLPVKNITTLMTIGQKFPAPGLYAFEVYIDDTYMAAASLVIVQS